MLDFLINCILWVCAIYGILEILKTIIYIRTCKNIRPDGTHIIIAVKNQENKIEGFLRSLNFRLLYGKEDYFDDIIVLDLNSTDNTKNIIENFSNDCSNVKIVNWNEFEELFSPKP